MARLCLVIVCTYEATIRNFYDGYLEQLSRIFSIFSPMHLYTNARAFITYAGSASAEDAICHTENNLLMYLLFTAQRVAAGESINKRTLTHSLNAADTTHVTVFHTQHILLLFVILLHPLCSCCGRTARWMRLENVFC
jgi:hypothetical protein